MGESMPNILSRAVLYEVSLSCWGTERKVDISKVNITANGSVAGEKEKDEGESEKSQDPKKEALRLTKSLIKCAELDAIRKTDGKIRQYVYNRALPSVRRKGVYFVPLKLVREVESRMDEFKDERAEQVESFCKVYEEHKEKAKAKLGVLYNERDYPTVAEVRDSFGFTTSFQAAGVSEGLKDEYPELFAKEQQKAEKAWAEAAEEIRQVMREGLKSVVDHMVDRLKGNGDGKPKVFRDSLVENMQEFLEMFEPRNITDDAELAALVAKVRKVMSGVEPAKLRDTPKLRKVVASGIEDIKTELDKLVMNKPARKTMAVA